MCNKKEKEGRSNDPGGPRLVFDVEADGLIPQLTKLWILCTYDLDTDEKKSFSDHDPELPGLEEGLEYLSSAREIVCHNLMTYDLLALHKVYNWSPHPETKLTDTLIYSQVLNYRRFGFGHSLDTWGEFLGIKKPEHEDWSRYSPEMRHRCEQDVQINVAVYQKLMKELNSRKDPTKLLVGIESEHYVSRFVGRANYLGWPVDVEFGKELLARIEVEMKRIESFVNPQLKMRLANVDAKAEHKSPTWIKNGQYNAFTARWFEIDPIRGLEGDRPIWGDYCRVQELQPDIGSLEAVKALLYDLGWVPTEWNWTGDKRKGTLRRSTPKLTDDSLEPLGEIGVAVGEYYTLRARASILSGWLEAVTPEGRLHGDCFVIGTPTRRSTHKIIANIPAEGKAAFGSEFRKFFKCKPGWKIIGCDSKGNQLRGLAHLINNEEFTKTILSGDIHKMNMEIIEGILGHNMPGSSESPENDKKVRRDRAKRFIYASEGAYKTVRIQGRSFYG